MLNIDYTEQIFYCEGDFVHSQPEVHQFTLPITGGRIIVASDGLWDMVNPKTACHHIRGMGSTQGGKALVGNRTS